MTLVDVETKLMERSNVQIQGGYSTLAPSYPLSNWVTASVFEHALARDYLRRI